MGNAVTPVNTDGLPIGATPVSVNAGTTWTAVLASSGQTSKVKPATVVTATVSPCNPLDPGPVSSATCHYDQSGCSKCLGDERVIGVRWVVKSQRLGHADETGLK